MVVLRGSSFKQDRLSEDYNTSYLKQIKYYASNKVILVLKDLDSIYSSLYDLFNKRFSLFDTKVMRCDITFEDYKDFIKIEPQFRVIVIKQISDLFKSKKDMESVLPSPLINRFEKHILTAEDFSKGSILYSYKRF